MALEHKGGVQAFIPAGPQALVRMAEDRLSKSQAALAAAKEVSKLLESARGRDVLSSSKVLIFEGGASVRAALTDWAEKWRESVVTYDRPWSGFQDESYLKHYGDTAIAYWEQYKYSRHEAKNTLRLFQERGPISKQIEVRLAKTVGARRQIRELPGVNSFSATLWVVGEYLVIIKTRNNPHYLLQIRDPLLSENVYAVFEKLWQLTSPTPTV